MVCRKLAHPDGDTEYRLSGTGHPGHHWSVTACSGAELGRTGMSKAAQIMACFGRELCLQPVLLRKARDEFEQARCQE